MVGEANPNDWTMQDAQRDASSEVASVSMRIRPDSLKELYEIDSLRALGAVAGTWAMIILTIASALWSHSVIVWFVAIFIIARCQHALMVLAHDAAHFRLLENRFWNDFIGHWICFWPVGSSLEGYRSVHLRHHRYLHTDKDPDLSLSRPYPATTASWRRKLIRDISGISELQIRGYIKVENGRSHLARGRMLRDFTPAAIARRIAFLAFLATLFYFGYLFAFIVLWVIPEMTVQRVIARVRAVLEHGGVPDRNDGLRNSRTIISRTWIMRFMMNPHHVAYHLEHHLFPAVPHYNLPKLHLALAADPRYEKALVDYSYSEAMNDVVRHSSDVAQAA
jgi:fatty acid desaturase